MKGEGKQRDADDDIIVNTVTLLSATVQDEAVTFSGADRHVRNNLELKI